jgi:hypothetical protein
MTSKEKDFLFRDYELKIGYLSNHFQRMWTRFNFFVTIESALLGSKFLIADCVPSVELAIAGIILSLLWYVMGAQDRYLVKLYRWQVEQAGKRIAQQGCSGNRASGYDYVGRVDEDIVTRFRAHERDKLNKKRPLGRLLERISGWRSAPFSTTHLAAFYPLIAVGFWVLILLMSKPLP